VLGAIELTFATTPLGSRAEERRSEAHLPLVVGAPGQIERCSGSTTHLAGFGAFGPNRATRSAGYWQIAEGTTKEGFEVSPKPLDLKGRLTSSIGIVAVVALVTTAMVVLGPAPSAKATCGDHPYTRVYTTDDSGWYMGGYGDKLNEGCYDGNVRYVSSTSSHRGQYMSDLGQWTWSSVGAKYLYAGTQSPVKVLIAGPISVDRDLRIGSTTFESWGTWWF
jgi:hypothetical protein